MVDSIRKIGLQGLQAAEQRALEAAEGLSKSFVAPNGDGDPAGDLIELKQAERDFKASAKVIKVADELDKEVLKIA